MKHFNTLKEYSEFLNSDISISQKIDGSAIIIKKIKGEIKFFTRENAKEISKIYLMASTFYKPAIEYFLNNKKVKKYLDSYHDNAELHFEYFPKSIKPIIPIINSPKNNLVLLFTKNIRSSVKAIADQLDVTGPPLIFKGKLTEDQKQLLLSGEMNNRILKKLNPKFVPIINPDIIEGIVLSDGKNVYKITDKLFTDKILSKKSDDSVGAPKEYLNIIKQIAISFCDYIEIPANYKFTQDNLIELLLSTIIREKDNIITKNNSKFDKYKNKDFSVEFTDIDWPSFPSSLVTLMKKYPWFKDVVRTILLNYSKHRKRAIPGIEKEINSKFIDKLQLLMKEERLTFKRFLENL